MNMFTPAYVIKYWYASNQPDSDGNYVLIQGRREGLTSWLLSLVKIEPNIELRCTRSDLHFTEGSFQGRSAHVTPMRGICSTLSGYEKPVTKAVWVFIIIASIGASVGGGSGSAFGAEIRGLLIGGLLGGLVGLGLGALSYFLNKTFTLGFTMNSGELTFIRFKRSVIEGQSIDESQAEYVAQLVQSLIEARAGAAQRP